MAQTELFGDRAGGAPPETELAVLDSRRRGATFVAHRVQSVVNPPEQTGMGFWSINPYIGCEYGCTYCYARYAHRYTVERAHRQGRISDAALAEARQSSTWEAFEYQIFIKQRDTVQAALERILPRIRQRHRGGHRHPLVIGTATDPYQPAERQFAITRSVLERLAEETDLAVGIVTKSPQVVRDLGVLERLSRRNRLSVYLSLITTDVRILRLFEARSPMPHVRLKALASLTAAGVNAGLIVAPVLPGITDTTSRLRDLAAAVHHARGRFAAPSPLRLYPALHQSFLPLIKTHFPDLYPRYRRVYRGAGLAPRHYTEAVYRRFRRIMSTLGIATGDPLIDRTRSFENAPTADQPQFGLWRA